VLAIRQSPSAVGLFSSSDPARPRVTKSELSSICCHGIRANPQDKPPAKVAALATSRPVTAGTRRTPVVIGSVNRGPR
jgi:hypothetical protein